MKTTKSSLRRDVMSKVYFRDDDRLNNELTKEELKKRMENDEKFTRVYFEYMRNENFDVENDWDDCRDYRDMIQTIFGHVYLNKDVIREFNDIFMYEQMKLYIDRNYKKIIEIVKWNMEQFKEANIKTKFQLS